MTVLCDVSVLLHALFAQSPHHNLCREALQSLLVGPEQLGVADQILASVMRIATNPRVYQPAGQTSEVFDYLNALRGHPRAVRVKPGEQHWQIFQDLIEATGTTGSDSTDAWFAALAIEQGCEWWSTDRDFARYPGLAYRDLLAEQR